MAHHEEIMIWVENFDDLFPQTILTTDHSEDGLLSPSLFSSQSSESYSPSSESIHSFNSNLGSPLWYSPESPYQLSATSSPYSTTSAELEPTVSPRDITTSPFIFGYGDLSTQQEEPTDSIEPLFEESAEDTASRDLRAIDGIDPRSTTSSTLFGAQRTTDLHITIPTPPQPLTPVSSSPLEPASGLSPLTQYDELEYNGQEISGSYAQYSGSPTASSLLSQSPSPSPQHDGTTRRRRPSHAGSDSLRTKASSTRSVRHSPYQQPMASPVANKDSFGQETGEDMTLESFKLVKGILIQTKDFRDFNFDGGRLPPLLKAIVGSDQTRMASQVRRTDNTVFYCPISNCGSTLTKRHNLKHHIESHFVDPNYVCQYCSSRMSHHASLKRHERGCGKKKATPEHTPISKGRRRGRN